MNMTASDLCQVCNEANRKYKCPKCFCLYCSVDCFKIHKPDCKPLLLKSQGQPVQPSAEVLEDEDVLSEHILSCLEDNNKLKAMLHNPHLRKILMNLDNSVNKTELMEKLMHEPLFVEFADICLAIVRPEKPNSL